MNKNPTPAQAIKKELSKVFPSIKFSCRYKTFSMGDSVDVDRIDGPTTEEVDAIIHKYQYGHFDGMIDMYEMSNCRDDIPQAKFVSCDRRMSEQTESKLMERANQHYNQEDRQYCSPHNLAYQLFRQYPVYGNFEVVRNSETCVCGFHNFYSLKTNG